MNVDNSPFEMVILKTEKFDSKDWFDGADPGDSIGHKDDDYPTGIKIKTEELENPINSRYISDKSDLMRQEIEDADRICVQEEFSIDIEQVKLEENFMVPEDIADKPDSIKSEVDPMLAYSEKRPYKCDVCSNHFRQKNQIRIHMQIHLREQPYSCDICLATFNLKGNLSTHLRIHEDKSPHTCNICSAQFNTEKLLDNHLESHDEKPNTCYFCYSKFGSQNLLKEHMRIHIAEKILTCSVCRSTFSTTSSLKQHMRIHTGEKPHQCDVCERRFTARSNFMRHLKTHSTK